MRAVAVAAVAVVLASILGGCLPQRAEGSCPISGQWSCGNHHAAFGVVDDVSNPTHATHATHTSYCRLVASSHAPAPSITSDPAAADAAGGLLFSISSAPTHFNAIFAITNNNNNNNNNSSSNIALVARFKDNTTTSTLVWTESPLAPTLLPCLVWTRASLVEPYPMLSQGQFTGLPVPASPDPLVQYQWDSTANQSSLQIFFTAATAVYGVTPSTAFTNPQSLVNRTAGASVGVVSEGVLVLDFGYECAGWLEMQLSDPLPAGTELQMSISEVS